MNFVDTSVFMYAVGREHPDRARARRIFAGALESAEPLATSVQVVQELLHAYVPVRREETLDAALSLLEATTTRIWPVEPDDVRLARSLVHRHPGVGSRVLLHLASCIRRDASLIHTFDGELRRAFRDR